MLRATLANRPAGAVLMILATVVATPAAGAQTRAPWYLRAGAGAATASNTTVADRDCHATAPPALFGCGTGSDGRRLAARGDLGRSARIELGVGKALTRALRVELTAAALPSLALDAKANFVRVAGAQPVAADLRTSLLLAGVAWDLAAALGRPAARWQPFLTAAAGVAWHDLDPVTYWFPGIAPGAETVTQGGTRSTAAWSVGGGVAFAVDDRLTLELALRREDLGTVRTDAGPARIVRPRGTVVIDVAPTEATLRVDVLGFATRWSF